MHEVGKVIGKLGRGIEEVRQEAIKLTHTPHLAIPSIGVFTIAEGWNNEPNTASWLRDMVNNGNIFNREAAVEALAEYYNDDSETFILILRMASALKYGRFVDTHPLYVLIDYYRDAPETLALLRELVHHNHLGPYAQWILDRLEQR